MVLTKYGLKMVEIERPHQTQKKRSTIAEHFCSMLVCSDQLGTWFWGLSCDFSSNVRVIVPASWTLGNIRRSRWFHLSWLIAPTATSFGCLGPHQSAVRFRISDALADLNKGDHLIVDIISFPIPKLVRQNKWNLHKFPDSNIQIWRKHEASYTYTVYTSLVTKCYQRLFNPSDIMSRSCFRICTWRQKPAQHFWPAGIFQPFCHELWRFKSDQLAVKYFCIIEKALPRDIELDLVVLVGYWTNSLTAELHTMTEVFRDVKQMVWTSSRQVANSWTEHLGNISIDLRNYLVKLLEDDIEVKISRHRPVLAQDKDWLTRGHLGPLLLMFNSIPES